MSFLFSVVRCCVGVWSAVFSNTDWGFSRGRADGDEEAVRVQ